MVRECIAFYIVIDKLCIWYYQLTLDIQDIVFKVDAFILTI